VLVLAVIVAAPAFAGTDSNCATTGVCIDVNKDAKGTKVVGTLMVYQDMLAITTTEHSDLCGPGDVADYITFFVRTKTGKNLEGGVGGHSERVETYSGYADTALCVSSGKPDDCDLIPTTYINARGQIPVCRVNGFGVLEALVNQFFIDEVVPDLFSDPVHQVQIKSISDDVIHLLAPPFMMFDFTLVVDENPNGPIN
jgi:hypothetical protein